MKYIRNLGQMIKDLKEVPAECQVRLDLGVPLVPQRVSSYRGYYEDLAIEYSSQGTCTVGELLQMLENAVGSTFTGYKGGEFTMKEHSRLWVANYGEYPAIQICNVLDGPTVILECIQTED